MHRTCMLLMHLNKLLVQRVPIGRCLPLGDAQHFGENMEHFTLLTSNRTKTFGA